MVRASRRAGVPVFILPASMPTLFSDSVTPRDAASPARPPSALLRPQCISPERNVPAVSTNAPHENSTPICVLTPFMRGFSPSASKSISVTESCQIKRFSRFSNLRRHSAENAALSHCARGLHIAAPLERLSIRNCMVVRSVTMPVSPPRASISRTICPLATPPIAGLHDIEANLVISIVTSRVRQPRRAAAEAASQPACPAPTTIIS